MPLPTHFYTTQQLKQGEQDAASERGLELFHLMERAGQAVFTIAFAQYPTSHHWLICCGGGNNGGDGYIVAVLARHMGIDVTVWQLGDPENCQPMPIVFISNGKSWVVRSTLHSLKCPNRRM